MNVVFKDKSFVNVSSPIDNFESLVWTKKWYESGSFSITMKASYYSQVKDAIFIMYVDDGGLYDYMIIEDLYIDSNMLTVSGSSLESMLDWRVMYSPTYYNAHIEDSVRDYVTLFATNSVSANLAFVNTPLSLATAKGYTDTADAQTEIGVLLSDAIRRMYKPLGWAFTVTRGSGATLIFDTVKGKDRTTTQSVNSWAVFATTTEDISKWSYNRNNKDYRNFVFMRSVWSYDAPTDTDNGSETREYDGAGSDEHRFIYMQPDTDYTTAQMDALMIAELTKYPVSEFVSCEISEGCHLTYGTDYSLGDICEFVINEIGLSFTARITAVDFVYENGSKKIIPTYGEEKLNPRGFIKRETTK